LIPRLDRELVMCLENRARRRRPTSNAVLVDFEDHHGGGKRGLSTPTAGQEFVNPKP